MKYVSTAFMTLSILSACGKGDGGGESLPGPGNNALGLRASDCGEHVWEKYFSFDFARSVEYGRYEENIWDKRTARISSIKGNGKSTNTANYSDDPRCRSLERALSSGVGKWESDTPFVVFVGSATSPRIAIEKDGLFVYSFDLEIESNEKLPRRLEDFDPEVLSGRKSQEVKELVATLGVTLAPTGSDISRGPESRPVELNCKKPFSYKILFTESDSVNETCRKREGSDQYECARVEIAPTGDECVFKANDFEVLDEKGQTIKVDLGGYLGLTTRNDGTPGYNLSVSSVTLK
ncbi:MAG: hypothetical protein M3Q07_13635 [Pseudobdellovibrionaceae bacterium]|nr:hypothetical protein [Pseudobdellovibrionaceae bacterium]